MESILELEKNIIFSLLISIRVTQALGLIVISFSLVSIVPLIFEIPLIMDFRYHCILWKREKEREREEEYAQSVIKKD